MRGRFITFEGGEGTGKSTHAALLASRIKSFGIGTLLTREPGGSPGAEVMRYILLSGAVRPLGANAEAVVFAAARDDHLNTLIRPALEQALAPASNPRYVVSRPSWPPGLTPGAARRRALTFRRVLETSWHPVPADLATHKQRAEAYHAAWQARMGRGELLFCGREGAAGRDAAALAASAAEQWVTSPRELWH